MQKHFTYIFFLVLFSSSVCVSQTDEVITSQIISFEATINGESVDINWKTSKEINSDYFIVEGGTDTTDFDEIATVNASGESNSELPYSIIDFDPIIGESYYRVKLVDKDYEFVYSKIISVNLTDDSSEAIPTIKYMLKGNGNVSVLLLNFNENIDVLVVLKNDLSQEYYSGYQQTNFEGIAEFTISPNRFIVSGNYFLSASSINKVATKAIHIP
jgi:hypothetical protein